MNVTETQPPADWARIRRASHAGKAHEADIAECRELITRQAGLHYLAHITSGILDFAIETPDLWPPGQDMREAFDRAGRELNLAVAQLDSACEPLDTGMLIRVVIQGENGAMFQVLKVAGQSFFGVTLDGAPGTVDGVDRQVARVAESAARRIGATSLLWGGFQNRDGSGELWHSYQAGSPVQSASVPFIAAGNDDSVADSVTELCRDALHRDDLHYVGIYHRGQPSWHADVFDDPTLAPLFQRVAPWSRRRGYERLIRQVNLQVRRFKQLLTLVRSDQLIRVVLDVARGAIYLLPLDDGEYLVGVTLIQSEVERADSKIQTLRDSLRSVASQHTVAQRE
jgi:hypothetical protein